MVRLALAWMAALSWLLALTPASAAPKNPFRVEITDAHLAPGSAGELTVTVVVPDGFHVYRDMMSVSVTDNQGVKVGEPSFPRGVEKPDPANPGELREQYDLDVLIDIPVTASDSPGVFQVSFDVRYQGCKDSLCYMPATDNVVASVFVEGEPVGAAQDGDAGAGIDEGAVDGGEPADAAPPEPVKVTAGQAVAGRVAIEVALVEGWHVNRDFMSLRVAGEGGPVTVGDALDMPEGEPFVDPATGFSRTDLSSDFTLGAAISGPDGDHDLALLVGFQACKESLCLMPQELPVTVQATIGGGAGAQAPAGDAVIAGGGDAFSAARASGLWALLVLVFVAGLGVSLTPCVLPMVPITIGIIGARSAGSRIQAISLAATYVAGLALVYSALGVAAGVTGMMFGAWMQSPWVVGSIAALFFAMGLSMFGLFDVGMPPSIQTKLAQYGGSGYGGAFVIGMIGALVAGPCSGPVLVSIIALIGQNGEVGLGALLMVVFSVGMGMIFLVAGAFSSTLLRPGAWMATVKKSFGLFMWAGALYFAAPHLSETVTALIAAAMLLVTAVYGWPDELDGEGFWVERGRRLYSVTAGLVGAYLLLGVLLTKGFILPPVALSGAGPAATTGPAAAHIGWSSDEAGALAQASAEGRPLMVDFTADWCAACKELEHFTYTDGRVIEAAGRMVPVMIDATNDKDPRVAELLEKYGVLGLPTVKFLRSDGTPIEELTVTGYIPADEFLPRMMRALDAP